MRIVFMVAEKPSLALSISQFLSHGQLTSRKCPYNACSTHEWNGKFRNESVRFRMTSVLGHVMTLDFPGKYNNWDATDPAELFTAPVQKKEATENQKMPSFLAHEARGTDILVLWLDCDKEGENICFEVIDCVSSSMNQTRGKNMEIYRAKFSAITEQEIFHAMNTLVYPNKNEALAVDGRQELDLRVGCAFTRFQTKFFQGKYGNLDSTLISYGPCQTPTLGFCVDRHDRILAFKPEPFWRLKVSILVGDIPVALSWCRGRVFERDVANFFLNSIKGETEAIIERVDVKEKSKPRPMALNTVEMLRAASSGLGMGPQQAMHVAEKLYTQGYISYPRTETTSYPESFNLRAALQVQSHHAEWGSVVKGVLQTGINRPRKGVDVGDHPPITPMKAAHSGELSREMWILYEFITKHFIATLMGDCKYLLTRAHYRIGNEKFISESRKVIDPGFTALITWKGVQSTEEVADDVELDREEDGGSGHTPEVPPELLKPGKRWPIQNSNQSGGSGCSLSEGQTRPPDYLSEADLITLMERHGIGTDASIPVHIQNICDRNYVQLIAGRRLKPTALGVVLVHGYQKIDPQLVLPQMRSAVEEQLNLIAHGQADYLAVLRHAKEIFAAKFIYFVQHIAQMDLLFDSSFSTLAESGKPFSRCGKCRRYMKLITTRPQRLYCPQCNDTLALPVRGNIKPYKEIKCPLDEYELVLWTEGGKGKSFPLCPYCFCNPPFEDMQVGWGCNQCTHPTCPQAPVSMGVAVCHECVQGTLQLDISTPPKYRLNCNKCDVVVVVSEAVRGIAMEKDVCDECGARNLHVKLDNNKPLGDGSTEFHGCVFCCEELFPYFESGFAKRISAGTLRGGVSRGGGGRGRGRGGGGRGRGRGGRRGRGR